MRESPGDGADGGCMERLESLQRQIQGLITKVQSGTRLSELDEDFSMVMLAHLTEIRDLVILEIKRTNRMPAVPPAYMP